MITVEVKPEEQCGIIVYVIRVNGTYLTQKDTEEQAVKKKQALEKSWNKLAA